MENGPTTESRAVFRGSLDKLGSPFDIAPEEGRESSSLTIPVIEDNPPDPDPHVEDLDNDPPAKPVAVQPIAPLSPEPPAAPSGKSVWSKLGNVLKEKSFFGDDAAFTEEATPDEFIEALTAKIETRAKDLVKNLQDEVEEIRAKKAAEIGYTEDNRKYVDYLLDGGRPEDISAIGQLKKLSTLEIKDEDLAKLDGVEADKRLKLLEDNRKRVVSAYYQLRGMDSEVAQTAVDAAVLKNQLESESVKAQAFIDKQAKDGDRLIAEQNQRRVQNEIEAQKKERQSTETFLKEAKDLAGYPLDDNTRTKILKATYEETETVEIKGPDGKMYKKPSTLLQKKIQEITNDPKRRALLQLLIINDFDFKPFTTVGARKKNDELREALSHLSDVDAGSGSSNKDDPFSKFVVNTKTF